MKEIKNTDFYRVLPLFDQIKHNVPLVYAVLHETYNGRVFVDNINTPKTAIVTLDDYVFINGDATNAQFNSSLYDLFYNSIFPEVQFDALDVHAFCSQWEEILTNIFSSKIIVKPVRLTFALNKDKFLDIKPKINSLSDGYEIKQIDRVLVEQYGLNKDFWRTEHNRFGVMIVKHGQIICECVSVFTGDGKSEISIETKENYRRRGFAFLAAVEFIEYCFSIDIEPCWACWDERKSSIALAQKLGYYEVDRHHAIVIGK